MDTTRLFRLIILLALMFTPTSALPELPDTEGDKAPVEATEGEESEGGEGPTEGEAPAEGEGSDEGEAPAEGEGSDEGADNTEGQEPEGGEGEDAEEPAVTEPEPGEPQEPSTPEQDSDVFAADYDMETITWAGQEWGVRDMTGPYYTWTGPQATYPNDGDEGTWIPGATVDANGNLVLSNEGINGAVEITTVESMGYGSYSFTYTADFNAMDPNNVLGIFTYDTAEMVLHEQGVDYTNGDGSTEIDFIEISRWGSPKRKLPHAGVTYYPDDNKTVKPERYNTVEADVPAGVQTLTTKAEWGPDYLYVITTLEDGTILFETLDTERIPTDRNQQLKLNLWTTSADKTKVNGKPAYAHAKGDTITFTDFSYVPRR